MIVQDSLILYYNSSFAAGEANIANIAPVYQFMYYAELHDGAKYDAINRRYNLSGDISKGKDILLDGNVFSDYASEGDITLDFIATIPRTKELVTHLLSSSVNGIIGVSDDDVHVKIENSTGGIKHLVVPLPNTYNLRDGSKKQYTITFKRYTSTKKITVYIDGEKVTERIFTDNSTDKNYKVFTNCSHIAINSMGNEGTDSSPMTFYSAKIYNKALNDAEALQNFENHDKVGLDPAPINPAEKGYIRKLKPKFKIIEE